MKNSKKRIAFIYEGVKSEDELLANVISNFFSEQVDIDIFSFSADGNIYMLWLKLKKDEYETNVIDVLKEVNADAKRKLEEGNLKASDFSEVYLFFDYDGHNDNIPREYHGKDILGEMLAHFDNETELGKLYISYPMIEAIKEIDNNTADYKRLHILLDEICNYKHSFYEKSDFGKYANFDRNMWKVACKATLKRASLIVNYKYLCTYEEFIEGLSQIGIYVAEKENYINNGHHLAVLNSVPLFLLEYFDKFFWLEMIEDISSIKKIVREKRMDMIFE